MDARNALFSHPDPYDLKGTGRLFVRAMRDCCVYHYVRCPEYRDILDSARFDPYEIKSLSDIAKLPFLPTVFLKRHRIYSMPQYRMPVKATSSGTGGVYSRIGFDTQGLFCGLKMVLKVFGQRGIVSPQPCHYVILGYKPHRGNHTAIAKTAYGYTLLTPAVSRTFALKYSDGGYKPDLEGVAEAVVRNSRSPFPTRFIGFPAYTWFMLRLMDERGMNVKLPVGSKIMLGGGWKQFYKEQVDKTEMYALAKKVLDIGEENIIESYGAAEHPILYCDCRNHHFHIPVYSRVIIRDVNTLEPVGYGQVGLVNLITPMVYGTPIQSIVTDDLGIMHRAEECGCGIRSPYLEIIGRAGFTDVKTCAAGAEEILKAAGGDAK